MSQPQSTAAMHAAFAALGWVTPAMIAQATATATPTATADERDVHERMCNAAPPAQALAEAIKTGKLLLLQGSWIEARKRVAAAEALCNTPNPVKGPVAAERLDAVETATRAVIRLGSGYIDNKVYTLSQRAGVATDCVLLHGRVQVCREAIGAALAQKDMKDALDAAQRTLAKLEEPFAQPPSFQ